jgi:hypothetical protein
MKIIAHRANIDGISEFENHPSQIKKAIKNGFDVEIDIWNIDEKLFLGHDKPQYQIGLSWLNLYTDKLWIHLKNIEAFKIFKNTNFNYFWHENDKFTLTSKNIPWCYHKIYMQDGITVLTNETEIQVPVYGVCTDYPLFWEKKLNFINK